MARMGVFSRNDSTPDSVPRSLQLLSHRHSFTTQYMRIVPNFAEILYPNESISLQVTNFIRTIPMQKPMLSRIRVVQRFCAVPLRILWQQWEDYIKGENEAQFLLQEPFIINNMISEKSLYVPSGTTGSSANSFLLSCTGNHILKKNSSGVIGSYRGITLDKNSYVINPSQPNGEDCSAVFAPRELGDYFGAPLFANLSLQYILPPTVSTKKQLTHPFSAFKFAAYQLAYSYFDRHPNVQTRIDDYYEMSKTGRIARGLPSDTCEFPPLLGVVEVDSSDNPTGFAPVVNQSYKLRYFGLSYSSAINVSDSFIGTSKSGDSTYVYEDLNRDIAANIDSSSQTYQQDVIRSSWENVEKFPLKSGANLSMLAWYNDPSTGIPTAVPSNISLSRIRYANWQTDYFTSCNPWQQRGDEAQIPISGSLTITIGDLSFTGTADIPASTIAISAKNVEWYTQDGLKTGNIIPAPIYSNPLVFSVADVTDSSIDDGSNISLHLSDPVSEDNLGLRIPGYNLTIPPSVGSVSGTASGGSAPLQISGLYVSPSNFRFAMTLQHIKEMQAQIDNRYQSYIHKFFGARARDYRLDRPEFIGGSVFELNVSDVTQTSETTESSNLADVAGKSVTADTSRTIRYHADEHCVILGTLHIIPDTEYIGGLNRVDSTQDRFDWVLPQFGHLSEQPVYNRELVYNGRDSESVDDEVFGYEPIYNNLRWRKNFATCDFRDVVNFTGNREEYKPWLQIKDYGQLVSSSASNIFKFVTPTLSDQFLSGRYNRDNSNFVVTDDNLVFPFMVDSYFKERMVRIIPSRGTPTRLGA